MSQSGWIEPIVERVVAQVLDGHVAQLRTEIARRVMEEIAAASASGELSLGAASSSRQSANDPAALARAVAEIQLGSSQREILRALLDTSASYASRVALFVVKGNHATGWQGRGFVNDDAIKDFALDETVPAVVCAIRDREVTNATADDLDPRFFQHVGMPASGGAQILPLMLKDKVAALIYADSGTHTGGTVDLGSLELLVLSTGAWLEVNSLRKQAQKEPHAAYADHQSATESSPHAAAPAYNDPFAAHATSFPGHAMAAAASAGEASSSVASPTFEATQASDISTEGIVAESNVAAMESVEAATAHAAPTAVASAAAAAPAQNDFSSGESQSGVIEMDPVISESSPLGDSSAHSSFANETVEAPVDMTPASTLSPEDQDVNRKAQRFARLLVDEIKLYNQAKVMEGRKNKDLYDRLKEVIEKSRITYQKRYGSTVAASGNYFQHEIIRSLAEDDLSIMGASFRH